MSAKLMRIFCALLVLAGLMTLAAAEDIPADAPPLSSEYSIVAENDRFALYLRPDIMAIIIESKTTGARLYSAVQNPQDMKDNATWKGFYQSGIVMEYIEDVKPTPVQADFLNTKNTIDYAMLDNGFTAHVTFPDIGISFDVTVTLSEKGIHVHIPQDSFVEAMADKTADPTLKKEFRIAAFSVFPFLGHSYLGEDEGYILIPDGQGALIKLQNNGSRFNSPYDNAVYGDNVGSIVNTFYEWYMEPEQIMMPVYGIARTQEQIAFLGVIEEGDAAARIRAYPNGVITKFDWVASRFVYRYVYNQPTVDSKSSGASFSSVNMVSPERRDFDIVLHFFIAEGEEANYTGMAKLYREYLIEKGTFAGLDQQKSFDMGLEFFGAELENDLFGKKDIAMTTFSQAEDILRELHAEGVTRVTASWIGWQEDGMTGGMPQRSYNPSSILGGKSGLSSLRSTAEDMGIQMLLEADLLSLNLDTHPASVYDAFKLITGTQWEKPTYKKVFEKTYMLMPEVSLEHGQKIAAQLADNDYSAIAISGIPGILSDYEDKSDKYRDSTHMMTVYKQLFSEIEERLRVHMARPNAYLWQYADAMYDMPLSASDYIFTSGDVPFMSIVLSGQMPYYAEYVNFQANSTRFFLQLIEQGAFPTFLLTLEDPILLVNSNSNEVFSSQYELYKEMIVQWYNELEDVFEQIGGASIEKHERTGDLVKVVWSNGVTVYINYDNIPGEIDQITLDGFSYKVVK